MWCRREDGVAGLQHKVLEGPSAPERVILTRAVAVTQDHCPCEISEAACRFDCILQPHSVRPGEFSDSVKLAACVNERFSLSSWDIGINLMASRFCAQPDDTKAIKAKVSPRTVVRSRLSIMLHRRENRMFDACSESFCLHLFASISAFDFDRIVPCFLHSLPFRFQLSALRTVA